MCIGGWGYGLVVRQSATRKSFRSCVRCVWCKAVCARGTMLFQWLCEIRCKSALVRASVPVPFALTLSLFVLTSLTYVKYVIICAPAGPTTRVNASQKPFLVLSKNQGFYYFQSRIACQEYMFRLEHTYKKSTHNSPHLKTINAQYSNGPRDIAQYKDCSVLWE